MENITIEQYDIYPPPKKEPLKIIFNIQTTQQKP